MPVPDYYGILGVAPNATPQQIREAYKRTALKTHPDRVPTNDPSRQKRTKKFQEVNDAYFTLSDPKRRKEYDEARKYNGQNNFYQQAHHSDEWQEEQFADVFEEMLKDEGVATESNVEGGNKLYGILGGISGAALGFIVGNVPGLLAGAVAGNRLGAIRDAKGKSVYEVYQSLPQSDKAKVLAELASKVLAHAASV